MNSIQYSDFFKDLLNEVENNFIEFGYHYTSRENYEKIKTDGLKVNQDHYLTNTVGNQSWVKTAYGMNPIFLSLEPLKRFGPRMPIGSEYDWVLLKVNVTGLDIAADLGMLIENGARVEENGFWFKQKPNWLSANEYSYNDLQGSDTFDLNLVIKKTRTFVVLQDIPVDKIKIVNYKGKTLNTFKSMFGFQ